jgi:hypothetical protein
VTSSQRDVPDARETLGQLTRVVEGHLGSNLLGLYLFGSLAAGGFYPGKSDLDLIAIVEAAIEEGEQLEALRRLHDAFVAERPTWVERIEVAYVSRKVLQTYGNRPRGSIAVISPGEPLHIRDAGFEATLNWYSACNDGETLVGPPPLELGPPVTRAASRRAVEELLGEWQSRVREPSIAYVPAAQGYIVVTLCRALHTLATGEQATKEAAAGWAAARYPDWATFIDTCLASYRADVHEAHDALIAFTDYAIGEAARAGGQAG